MEKIIKTLALIVLATLVISLVIASNNATSNANKTKTTKNMTFLPWQKINESECPEGCKCVGAVVSCPTETGKTMTITAGNSGNVITIVVDKTEVNTTLEIEQESEDNITTLKTTLSNGRKAEIKVMPETASQRAIERLGELGFNITLKEVSVKNQTGEEPRLAYEVQGEEQGKFLGLFKIKLKKQVQVDAETGEVILVKKPWYSFLVA